MYARLQDAKAQRERIARSKENADKKTKTPQTGEKGPKRSPGVPQGEEVRFLNGLVLR
jgi:hypothetical protein